MKAKFGHFKKKNIVLELLALLVLSAMFIFVISRWNTLPDTIPTHYDFQGNVDGWGGRGSVLLLPFIALGIEILITFVSFYPGIWNTPVQLNGKNRDVIVSLSLELMEYVKLICFVMFFFLLRQEIVSSVSVEAPAAAGFVGLFILLLFAVIAWYIYRMISINKKIVEKKQG